MVVQYKDVPVQLGKAYSRLSLPSSARVLQPPTLEAIRDPRETILRSLAEPIGTEPLAKLVAARHPRTAAITISDITRPVPNKLTLPHLLDVLNTQGVGDDQVTIIIATGMHRPSTQAELDIMLGPEILQRCEVVDHRADDASTLRQVSQQPPVSVNCRYLDADFKIVTGLIEPHFMAGFSGGRKGICPGLVDLAAVQRFHGHEVMGDSRADNGILEDNPCHEISMCVARLVGCDFSVNVAITQDRQLAGVYCGDLESAHLAGCRHVRDWTTVNVEEPFDLVITTAGGYPLDATYYQAVKGMVGALPATHEGSTLLLLSRCDEGVGSPEYVELMRRWGQDWKGFLAHISTSGRTAMDQWQMQMQTRATQKLVHGAVLLACDGLPPETVQQMGVMPVAGDGDAVARCQSFVDKFVAHQPDARIAVIPEGPYTMICCADALAGSS